MRYFIDISYKGTSYHGWQVQPNGVTVQEEIEKGLSLILGSTVSVMGSGRTDTGVHAMQQIAHFDFDKSIDRAQLRFKLNSFLPATISIQEVREVVPEASARFDATSRLYHYHINQAKNPFGEETSYYFNPPLDVDQITSACEIIKQWQNFECFSKVHTEVNNFNCEIFSISWQQTGTNHLFSIQANRFLRGMVRAIVGTLLDVGLGKKSLEDLKSILQSNDRRRAGRAVPAQGLFLQSVHYPEHIYIS